MDVAALIMILRADIMACFSVFAQSNPNAFRIAYHIVFNNPAPAPMRTNQANLLGCGRGPLCCGLAHVETANRNIISVRLVRIKTTFSNVDLYQFAVGVGIVEIRPDECVLIITFAIPGIG